MGIGILEQAKAVPRTIRRDNLSEMIKVPGFSCTEKDRIEAPQEALQRGRAWRISIPTASAASSGESAARGQEGPRLRRPHRYGRHRRSERSGQDPSPLGSHKGRPRPRPRLLRPARRGGLHDQRRAHPEGSGLRGRLSPFGSPSPSSRRTATASAGSNLIEEEGFKLDFAVSTEPTSCRLYRGPPRPDGDENRHQGRVLPRLGAGARRRAQPTRPPAQPSPWNRSTRS